LVISISILLTASFSFIPAVVGAEDSNSQPAIKAEELTEAENQASKWTSDVNLITDANLVADPNKTRLKVFEGLEEALERVDKDSKREIREWIRSTVENRLNLAKAVQRQVASELNFIRELAVEEGAVKTTEAIDRLLTSRKERFEEVIKKMEEEKKKARRIEREGRRDKRPTRGTRSRDQIRRDRREGRSRRGYP